METSKIQRRPIKGVKYYDANKVLLTQEEFERLEKCYEFEVSLYKDKGNVAIGDGVVPFVGWLLDKGYTIDFVC